jgi:hypothetical protein
MQFVFAGNDFQTYKKRRASLAVIEDCPLRRKYFSPVSMTTTLGCGSKFGGLKLCRDRQEAHRL